MASGGLHGSGHIAGNSLELILSRSVGGFALVLFALALPDLTTEITARAPWWNLVFIAAIPATILWAMLLRHPGPWSRGAACSAALLMLSGFLLWHIGLLGDGGTVESRPWSWGIAGAGIALATYALTVPAACMYGLFYCLLVLLVPLMDAGNTRQWSESWQDALLTLVMAIVIISPITALRKAAAASDNAAAAAVTGFTKAARAEAVSVERSRLDALAHDIIMSTLIVAAQAQSPEVIEAAGKAAREALVQLDVMRADDDDAPLSAGELVNRLNAATATYGAVVALKGAAPNAALVIPLHSSRALVQAATEAVRNSSIHGQGKIPTVSVSFPRSLNSGGGSVDIDISDDGPGFDLASIPAERLGIRISIIQRMHDVRGNATVLSTPGAGTTIQLKWDQRQGSDG